MIKISHGDNPSSTRGGNSQLSLPFSPQVATAGQCKMQVQQTD